jgi:hypothetical protein
VRVELRAEHERANVRLDELHSMYCSGERHRHVRWDELRVYLQCRLDRGQL